MESYCSLCALDTIHRLFVITILIINKINKVQWVDFKLENVLVSLHSFKTMGLGSIIFKEWRVIHSRVNPVPKLEEELELEELLGHSPMHNECVPNMGDWRAYTLTIHIHYIK